MSRKISPAGVMGDFVGKYNARIKPLIDEGATQGLNGMVTDVVLRGNFVIDSLDGWPERTNALFESALKNLRASSAENFGNSLLLGIVDRDVSELDFIMSGNEVYDRAKAAYV
ncbi:MAG: hypothetical protein KJ600_02050 [Nanoarchaeota archaeon]|nr:hypothetical protein [Nanoarchaeota archaeon]MBU1103319.1 hypothetical protein [Nanoarchaeota archaeon]